MPDVIRTLNDLIAVCRDSQESFTKGANNAHSENLKRRFAGLARQRANFAEELSDCVRNAGVEPAATGRRGGLQHSEADVRIRPKDDATFVAECQTGEKNTLRRYKRALAQTLPPEIREALERQRVGVEGALLVLRTLEQVRGAG